MTRFNDALLSLLRFVREALSGGRLGQPVPRRQRACCGRPRFVMMSRRGIPERNEELAWVLAALYGANQFAPLGEALAAQKQRQLP